MKTRPFDFGIELASLSAAVGLACMPLAYALIGALGSFSVAFSFLIFLPTAGCSLFLVYRLIKMRERPYEFGGQAVLMVFCWVAVLSFLWIVSGFALMRGSERVGVFSMLYLFSWGCVFVLMGFRGMNVLRRWEHRRIWATVVSLVFLLALCAAASNVLGSAEQY